MPRNDDAHMLVEMDDPAPASVSPPTKAASSHVIHPSNGEYGTYIASTSTPTSINTPRARHYCDCIACQDIVGDHTHSTQWQTFARWCRKFNRSFLGEMAKICITIIVSILVGYFAVKNQIDGLKSQVSDLQSQATSLQASVSVANRDLHDASSTIVALQSQFITLQYTANQTSLKLSAIDFPTLYAEANAVRDSLTLVNNRSIEATAHIDTAKEQLNVQIAQAQTRLTQASQQLASIKSRAYLHVQGGKALMDSAYPLPYTHTFNNEPFIFTRTASWNPSGSATSYMVSYNSSSGIFTLNGPATYDLSAVIYGQCSQFCNSMSFFWAYIENADTALGNTGVFASQGSKSNEQSQSFPNMAKAIVNVPNKTPVKLQVSANNAGFTSTTYTNFYGPVNWASIIQIE